jgi:acyl phosphate:glycerol-3-phosphate acyltransferase
MQIIISISLIILAYLIGAVPSGFLVARAHGIADITKHGSGNIGATNVARMLGLFYFFIVFLFDAAKAFVFLKLVQWMNILPLIEIIAAVALLVGNGYSIFLKGHGGKGVATSVGILLFFRPQVTMLLLSIWSAILLLTHTVGIASIITLMSLPFAALLEFNNIPLLLLMLFMSLWGVFRHTDNIKRFMAAKVKG